MKARSSILGTLAAWGSLFVLVFALPGFAQEKYPAPRYPKLPQVKSAEDLLDIARIVVKSPSRRETLRPGYGVKAGEKVLMVIPSGFSPLVRDALAMAIREAGAQLDILQLQSQGFNPEEARGGAKEGVQDGTVEATNMLEPRRGGGGGGGSGQKVMALGNGGGYDMIIEGSGGPQPVSKFRWERIPWDSVEKFIISAGFPGEVQDLVDQKIWDALKNAKTVHITDPEGTDLRWSVKPEHFAKLKEEYDDPIYPPGTYDVVKRGHLSLTPLFLAMQDGDAEGTIGGTINHAGVFPNVKLHLSKNHVQRAEGGGRYGETINAALKKWAHVQYPGFPGPGIGWFIEAALGTNPRRSRVTTQIEGEGMSWERGRSGVIHFGIGVATPVTASHTPEVRKKVSEEGIPGGHFHIHTYFNTIEIESNDGKKIKVADKGRITFLDDPDVRKLAAKYGNPDELLTEAWIPAVPGINAPGSYEEYAKDPARFIINDVQQLKATQK
jgi:hypothetical protein